MHVCVRIFVVTIETSLPRCAPSLFYLRIPFGQHRDTGAFARRGQKKKYSVTSGSRATAVYTRVSVRDCHDAMKSAENRWVRSRDRVTPPALCARKEVQLGSGAIHEFRGGLRVRVCAHVPPYER